MLCRTALTIAAVLGLLAPAQGQGIRRPRNDQQRQLPTEPFAADGSVEAVGRGAIRMLTTSNQVWMVWIDPKAVIHVSGTAEPDFVRPGMFIRFTAEIDKRGDAQNKIDKLTLFTPSKENPVGIWPEGAAPAAGGEGAANEPGSGFGEDVVGPRSPTTAVYSVAGQITGNRRGKLSVNALRAVVNIELAEKAAVAVDLADYTVAKNGDKISVSKGKMVVGRPGVAQASELNIELAQPLALPGRKKPPRTKPTTNQRTTPSGDKDKAGKDAVEKDEAGKEAGKEMG
ncbi:MAG: hypothetical protein JXB62_08810 [Pirellulales bacterium]|nr:hypothetical protein [Pirellulales bacterium]